MRVALYSVAIAVSVLLAACGGGGGGSTTTVAPELPKTATGSIVAVPEKCIVLPGTSGCEVTVTVVTANASTAKVIDSKASVTVPVNQSTSLKVLVPLGKETYTLDYGTADRPSVTVMAECGSGTFASSGQCVAKLTYSNVRFALRDVYPYLVSDDGLMFRKAENQTGFTEGGIPIWGCGQSEVAQPNGLFLLVCRIAANKSAYSILAWNVITNVLTKYEGAVPPGLEIANNPDGSAIYGAKWHFCQRFCPTAWGGEPPRDYMTVWVQVPNGWLYSKTLTNEIWVEGPNGENPTLVQVLPKHPDGSFSSLHTLGSVSSN